MPKDPWAALNQLEQVDLGGVSLKIGDRVRLRPQGRADILDLELNGKIATVEAIESSYDDEIYVAVVLDDDPGRDLGLDRMIGHRFFFRLPEVEPLS